MEVLDAIPRKLRSKVLPWKPVQVAPLGDIQLGSPGTDIRRLKEHVQRGVDTGVFWIGLGDFTDFLSPSNRRFLKNAGLYDTATELIEKWHREHMDEVKDILAPTRGMWLGFHEGHHFYEYASGNTSDTDLADFLDAPFLGTAAVTRLAFQGDKRATECLIWSHHGEGGGANPLQRLLAVAPGFPQINVFIQGHNTQLGSQKRDNIWFHGRPGKLRMRTREQLFVACGGFMQGYNQGSRIAGRAMGCVPTDTEALTRRGWLPPEELVLGEEVAAYDTEADVLRWTPLRAVQVYEDQEVLKVGSRKGGAGYWATANHRWFAYSGHNAQNFGVKQTQELTTHTPVKVAAPLANILEEGSVLNAREAAILGWVVTDGWFYPWTGQSGIAQKKEPFVTEIRELLGEEAHEYVGEGGTHYFNLPIHGTECLFAKAGVKSRTFEGIEALVTRLDRPARIAMKTAMEHAEGYRGSRGWRFTQKRETVLKAWEILCVLEGERLGALGKNEDSGCYNRRNGLPLKMSLSSIDLERRKAPFVWCPTTDYGSWVMRQADGAIAVTGNSYVEKGMMRPTALGGPILTITPTRRDGHTKVVVSCSI